MHNLADCNAHGPPPEGPLRSSLETVSDGVLWAAGRIRSLGNRPPRTGRSPEAEGLQPVNRRVGAGAEGPVPVGRCPDATFCGPFRAETLRNGTLPYQE